MIKPTHSQQADTYSILKVFALSSVLYILAACSGHSHLKDDATAGKQFEEKWEIEKIYYVGNKDDSKPDEQIGGEFSVQRSKDGKTFAFVPGENFSLSSEAWGNLRLDYKPGSEANEPLELVAGQLCQDDMGKENSDDNVVETTIYYDFIILNSLDLESLQGTLEPGKKNPANKDNRVTIFHFNDATQEDPDRVDILIFACGDAECKSSKMIRGRKL